MLPLVALIVLVPFFSVVASPAALIVAVATVPDAHTTLAVRFCVVPSLNVPVADRNTTRLNSTHQITSYAAFCFKKTAVTVSNVDPAMLPLVALIVLVPFFSVLASPAALIVAVATIPDPHTTLAVRFCVVPSLNVPVAVNCTGVPAATLGFAGVTAIDCKVAAVAIGNVCPPVTPPVPLPSFVPFFSVVASPPALIVAVATVPDAHTTLAVR